MAIDVFTLSSVSPKQLREISMAIGSICSSCLRLEGEERIEVYLGND